MIYLWGWRKISCQRTQILFADCSFLQSSLELVNEILNSDQFQRKHFHTPFLKIRNICAFTNSDCSLLQASYEFPEMTEPYSEPFQAFKMKFFAKTINVWRPLVIFAKNSILDVWDGFEYASAWYEVESCIELAFVNWLFLNYP